MILDKIENLNKYGKQFEFILTHLKDEFTKGKFDISEPQRFGIGLEYNTQDADKCLWEAHRKYLDIHCVLEGREIVEICDLEKMEPANDYVDDYQLFTGSAQHKVLLEPGTFMVLHPNEVHRTGVIAGDTALVRKFVFKLIIE
jgi:biofilm protein TabA